MGFLSYLALAIFSLFFASQASPLVLNRTVAVFYGVVAVVVGYGLLQVLDLDPFNWRLNYEGIIGNLGNPNFMSVIAALCAAIALIHFIESGLRNGVSYLHLFLFSSALTAVYFSKSTQGWIVFLISLAPWVFVRVKRVNLVASRLFVVAISSAVIAVALALFQTGPLSKVLYEQSLSFRADFWRIAWKMAVDNPWLGVGIDRYQNYYREYKTLEQVRALGAEDFSDSAHNLYLHFFATGGFPLGLLFLVINVYVGFRFTVVLKRTNESQTKIASIFGLWLGIQAQNLISIDYPSIALWSWIFGGLAVGLSVMGEGTKTTKENLGRKYIGVAASVAATTVSLVFLIPAASAQSMLRTGFYAYVEKGDLEAIKIKSDYLEGLGKKEPGNPTLPILAANSLFQDEAYEEAAEAARRAIDIDSHDYRAWWFLASSLENLDRRIDALQAREMTIKLSPYNSPNLLELARNQAQAEDLSGLEETIKQLREIDPNSVETLEAQKLLAP
jgi:O-antigen ligase